MKYLTVLNKKKELWCVRIFNLSAFGCSKMFIGSLGDFISMRCV